MMIISWSRHLARSSAMGRMSRGFAELPSINWKQVKNVPSPKIFTDDLYFDHKRESFLSVVKAVKENPNHTFSARAVAYFLYNMSEVGVNEDIIQDLIERYVARFRGNYTGRVAFGALAGGLKLNYKPAVLRTFAEDFLNEIENLEPKEIIEVYEAFSLNSSLPLEERLAMIKGSLEPELEKRVKEFIHVREMIFSLAMSMCRMKSVDSELCLRAVKSLSVLKAVPIKKQVELFQDYSALSGEVELSKELQEAIKTLRKTISAKKDAQWTYNTEELRDYTYEELYARRDQIKFPDQKFPATMEQDRLDRYKELKIEGEEAERLRRAGLDKTNIASTMSDEELLEVINMGGVAMSSEDLDRMVQSVGEDKEEEEDLTSRRSNKPQKKPSKPKFVNK